MELYTGPEEYRVLLNLHIYLKSTSEGSIKTRGYEIAENCSEIWQIKDSVCFLGHCYIEVWMYF